MKYTAQFKVRPNDLFIDRYSEAKYVEIAKQEIGVKFGRELFKDLPFNVDMDERSGVKTHDCRFYIISEEQLRRIFAQLEIAQIADTESAFLIIRDIARTLRTEFNRETFISPETNQEDQHRVRIE